MTERGTSSSVNDVWEVGEPEAVSPDDPIANGERWRKALQRIAASGASSLESREIAEEALGDG